MLLFYMLSYSIDGDTFLFSKADAMVYYDESIKMSSMSIGEGFKYLSSFASFDDWGAFMWMVPIMKIYPAKWLLNFSYIIIGMFSSRMLFNIGRNFMSRRYAFLCALAFAIASFTITFHAKFLKETIMIFTIIASFYYFFKYLRSKRIYILLISFLLAGFVAFFRVPTMILLFASYAATILLINVKRKIYLVPLIMVVLLASSFFSSFIEYSYQTYLAGGDVERIIERKVEMSAGGGFVHHITDPLAAIVGPFPSFIPKEITSNPLNASGLIFRLLIAFPFFIGVWYAVKYKKRFLYPLILFFFLEALGVAISVKGLEFRLTFPHLAMAYLVAFWTLFLYDYKIIRKGALNKYWNYWVVFVVFICILWNLRYVI